MRLWWALEVQAYVQPLDSPKLDSILLVYPNSFQLEVIPSLLRVVSMLLLGSEFHRWASCRALC
jgi:hypothetical protein